MEQKIKERPILFNAEMVRAILAGKKTQTRRALKNQENYLSWNCATRVFESDYLREFLPGADESSFVLQENSGDLVDSKWQPVSCPLGKIGDQLWGRETHAQVFECDIPEGRPRGPLGTFGSPSKPNWKSRYIYRADGEMPNVQWQFVGDSSPVRWQPSIHMHRIGSRIQLEITNVRLERLRSITEQDSLAEGVTQRQITDSVKSMAYSEFKNLWCSTYSGDNWDLNPWVWVIEFKRIAP